MPPQLKAIIFDYGNVLCEAQQQTDIDAMAAILGLPVHSFLPAYWRDRLTYDTAALTSEAYWNAVATQHSLPPLTTAQVATLVELDNKSWTHPSPVMLAWAKEVRSSGLRTAILSNMPLALREYLDNSCSWLPDFDYRTFSCDVRCSKPAEGIYQHCLTGLGVAPSEALFLDDREENIQAAEELGIHSVLFKNAEQARCEIETRFSIPIPLRG